MLIVVLLLYPFCAISAKRMDTSRDLNYSRWSFCCQFYQPKIRDEMMNPI